MLLREIEQIRWVFAALAGGGILALLFVLSYTAMWKTRKVEGEQAQVRITGIRSFYLWLQAAFPWILLLTMAGTFLFSILYPLIRAAEPPNW
ncbi:MAG: hypothetical protein U0411_11265 [Thermodesulfovibrionales bacterium]